MVSLPLCVVAFEPYLKESLPDTVWQYFRSGADDEQTMKDNQFAFQRYRLRPRCLRDVSQRITSTSVLGHYIAFPVGVSPVAAHGFAHPDGEIATAKGVCSVGSVMIHSMWSNKRSEDVASTVQPNTPLFHQLNFLRDRSRMKEVVRKAEVAGYRALVVTVDQPIIGNTRPAKESSLVVPSHISFPNALRPDESFCPQTAHELFDDSATWDTISWLKEITSLPIILKGILTAEDAKEAVKHGVAGILVSNHGGRQLDGTLATIDALPEVVNAVRDSSVEVYLDGGVRKGTDVLKALALGARAVFIGRPVIWGLAYDGENGVKKVLEILREEFSLAMALTGCSSVDDINPDMIVRLPHVNNELH
ncbi:hydroxyacid oxidase 1-like isoform X2 [Acanthaster planci]|nr:hydroxyacid oxidase 1-like isoform X2 [Acanthaster planci]XP_022103595.1 hydroxyacid oxidase 1-like isoform X2 [Acanthaster planci]